jgi:hypothetical protein
MVAKQRTELAGNLLCCRDQSRTRAGSYCSASAPPQGRASAGFHAELEAFHPDPADQSFLRRAGQPGPLRAVFVETGRADIDTELERPQLTESRRTTRAPPASSI